MLAALALLFGVQPAAAQARTLSSVATPSIVFWQTWDAWNLSRWRWSVPIGRLLKDYSAFLTRLEQSAPPSSGPESSGQPVDKATVESWRAAQMDAYRALSAEAVRLQRIDPPPPASSLRRDTLTGIVATSDPAWRDAATGGILGQADAVQTLIDLLARAAEGDSRAASAAGRQMFELQARQAEANGAIARFSFSAADDPSHDIADYVVEIDASLAALMRAAIADMAARDDAASAPADRAAVATEIRAHAANAERSLTLLAQHAAAKLERLESPQDPSQRTRAARVRATMMAFQQTEAGLAQVAATLRGSAQAVEAPDGTADDWLERSGVIVALMAQALRPLATVPQPEPG